MSSIVFGRPERSKAFAENFQTDISYINFIKYPLLQHYFHMPHILVYVLLQLFYLFWNTKVKYILYVHFGLSTSGLRLITTTQLIALKVFYKISVSLLLNEVILAWSREKPQKISGLPNNYYKSHCFFPMGTRKHQCALTLLC